MTKEIILREEFDNPQGRFIGYDAYDTSKRVSVNEQSHVDIRTFDGEEFVPVNMLYLAFSIMDAMNTYTMETLTDGIVIVKPKEPWTQGTVDEDGSRNYWHGISMDCEAGTTTTTSVITR